MSREHAPTPGVTWQTELRSTGERLVADDAETPGANRATRRAAKRRGAAAAPAPGARPNASQITDDQLDALYADRDKLAGLLANKVNELVDERRHYRIAAQAIGRVRALHQPEEHLGRLWCAECSVKRRTGLRTEEWVAFIPHPCPTLDALDGDASGVDAPAKRATLAPPGPAGPQMTNGSSDDPIGPQTGARSREPESASETHSHTTPGANPTNTTERAAK